MEVTFRTRKLEKEYLDHRKADQAYGEQIARLYIHRIKIIKQTRDLEELQKLPGLCCHPLKANLRGLWAIKLTGFYRLIFSLAGDRLEIVCIEEVSKHYGD
jgi:toxin HigB-1